MKLVKGEKYKVKSGHPFWSGREGIFEFMGGPDHDIVVLSDITVNNSDFAIEGWTAKELFAVSLADIVGF
jgi:hypothetical protein